MRLSLIWVESEQVTSDSISKNKTLKTTLNLEEDSAQEKLVDLNDDEIQKASSLSVKRTLAWQFGEVTECLARKIKLLMLNLLPSEKYKKVLQHCRTVKEKLDVFEPEYKKNSIRAKFQIYLDPAVECSSRKISKSNSFLQ